MSVQDKISLHGEISRLKEAFVYIALEGKLISITWKGGDPLLDKKS